MKPVLIKTFGCKVNYAESTEFCERLRAQGIPAQAYGRNADGAAAVLANTCCVTAEAGRKALQFVRKLKREQPGLAVGATGCGARLPELRERLAQAGAVVFATYPELEAWLREALDRETPPADIHLSDAATEAAVLSRARSFIKVQDGCGCRCSYCIIPQVRPRASRPVVEVLALVAQAVAAGQRELVLTGVNLGAYGREHPPTQAQRSARAAPLIALVEAVLARLPGSVRLRLSSLEPQDVDVPLLALFAHPQLCPHLHLPLQSGSDHVLRAMRRRYTSTHYLRAVERFRELAPHGAVTADILVGYPAETDADFAATLALCHAARFERVHGFPFSPRPGTPAANLPPLPPGAAATRNRELIDTGHAIADKAWARFLGTACPVLVEEPARGGMLGHGPAYQIVLLPEGEPGAIVDAVLTDYAGGQFHGYPN
jgi:threonylcarbamoyladenosine tRNA methylthiotransferase MtaB